MKSQYTVPANSTPADHSVDSLVSLSLYLYIYMYYIYKLFIYIYVYIHYILSNPKKQHSKSTPKIMVKYILLLWGSLSIELTKLWSTQPHPRGR
jgi:hypothetical protein